MKLLPLLLVALLAACDSTATSGEMSYNDLVNFPNRCDKADEQLRILKAVQLRKNFDPDPDNLNDADRAYNSRLKATIWWYAYECDKS
jgi:hypothetical protein